MNKYSWNFDEYAEFWNNDTYDTIKECIAEAEEENKLDGNIYTVVYIGENAPYIPTVDVEHILYDLQEQAADECGEIGGEWHAYDHKKEDELEELQENIDNVVHDWLRKHNRYPNFWSIKNIKRYKIGIGEDGE